MRLTMADGVQFFHFSTIPLERVTHGIFTRRGGISPPPWASLNFSVTVGDHARNIQHNTMLAHRALGLDPTRMMDRYIAHTTAVWHVDERHLGRSAPFADAVVTRVPGISLMMTFADCQSLLAYDPVHHILGVAHAGWRGTLGGIALSLVQALVAEGSHAGDLQVGIGPAIGSCCYEVGEDVEAWARTWPEGEAWLHRNSAGRTTLDLTAANEAILRRAGVVQIERSDLCTACRTDLFFSYRAERPVTGRFALLAALQ